MGKLCPGNKGACGVFAHGVFMDLQRHHQFFLPKELMDDTIIAMFGALLLFIIPSGKKTERKKNGCWNGLIPIKWHGYFIAVWRRTGTGQIPLEDAKLMQQLGDYIAGFSTSNTFLMILIITTIGVFK